MSVKNNAYLAACALALGVTISSRPPLVEALLDNIAIKKIDAAEVNDGTGRVLVFVTVTESGADVVRAVADTSGNVRLYADGSAVIKLAKTASLVPGALVRFVRFNKLGSVGDPVANLKIKYKKAKAEKTMALLKLTDVVAKKSAGLSLGWDTAIGTPENLEYMDIVDRFGGLTEWGDLMTTIEASLRTALTNAGIDPLTVV